MSRRWRLVIVDDAEDLRRLIRLFLEQSGDFEVVGEAGDGAAGIDVTRDVQPDAVLLDLAMPVMDGLQALPLLLDVCPTALVVILSGFGTEETVRAAREQGVAGFLHKGPDLKASLAVNLKAILTGHTPADP